jgi:hypothetical protein
MATAKDFRRIALGMRDTAEAAHMSHPDFRVNGRIFASLTQDESRGMVVLTPDQQQTFVGAHRGSFEPESGAWGRSGCTRVHLRRIDEETLGEALTLAWQNGVAKGPTRSKTRTGAARPPAAKRTARARPSRSS